MPTDAQIAAAHAAFEHAAAFWEISGVKDRHQWMVSRNHKMIDPAQAGDVATGDDLIAFWKFDTRDEAIFFKRDKCLRAALDAAFAATG
jgi:hypothetical protein